MLIDTFHSRYLVLGAGLAWFTSSSIRWNSTRRTRVISLRVQRRSVILVYKIETFVTGNKIGTFRGICNEKDSVKLVLFDIFDVNRVNRSAIITPCLILFYICHCDRFLSLRRNISFKHQRTIEFCYLIYSSEDSSRQARQNCQFITQFYHIINFLIFEKFLLTKMSETKKKNNQLVTQFCCYIP